MTSSPPAEPQHFRGKTLTPESPVPVHVPEPHNIPVLQNQIDPIFNLVSTHMENTASEGHDAIAHASVSQDFSALQDLNASHGERGADTGAHLQMSGEAPAHSELYSQAHASFPIHKAVYSHDDQASATSSLPQTHSPLPRNDDLSSYPAPVQDQTLDAAIPYRTTHSLSHNPDLASEPSTSTIIANPDAPAQSQHSATDVDDEDVNYQALLDSLTPAVSLPLSSENNTSTAQDALSPHSPSGAETPIATFPVPVGLPARPPPQEKPAIHPNYNADEDIRSYHNPPPQSGTPQSNGQTSSAPQYPPQTGPAPNGMNPPPLATFQQTSLNASQVQNSPQGLHNNPQNDNESSAATPSQQYPNRDVEQPPGPEVEGAYQDFLRDEARYTSQGQWERFPPGSRLFIGKFASERNLFTEKVTKRDLFFIFHKYGKLAQISMKSAYGFIQYVQAADCNRAMQTEQGLELKGRKINLEISKPQKNTRNAGGGEGGGRNHGRRSRSPEHRRGGNRGQGNRSGGERYDRTQNPNDFQLRARDDYRPGRSPSPRGFRGHDNYRGRDRSPDRYHGARRSRSRSPHSGGGFYRDRSPRGREMDEEANLPFPRRQPGNTPDVQIILAEEVDRAFVGYIQQSLRERGLRSEVLQMMPRVAMSAVIKRQILEGVLAVVKIFRRSQVTGKIPLQVFNRSQGYNNVQFDEYEDLDANVAAEIVVRAKSTHAAPPQMRQQYPPAQNYANPQLGQNVQQLPPHHGPSQPMNHQAVAPQQPQLGGPPPNVANLITSLDGPSLQKLLSSMAQNQQSPQNPMHPQAMPPSGPSPDLSALLSSVASQQHRPQGGPQSPFGQHGPSPGGYPPYGGNAHPQFPPPNGQAASPPIPNNTALSQLLMSTANRGPQPGLQSPGAQQQQQQNVQDIMTQLARYK